MNDILSGITEILDDPAAAAKIGEIAKSLSGGEKSAETTSAVKETMPVTSPGIPGLNSFSSADRHITLLRAIQPYMRSERSEKIGTAIKAISVLKTLSGLK